MLSVISFDTLARIIRLRFLCTFYIKKLTYFVLSLDIIPVCWGDILKSIPHETERERYTERGALLGLKLGKKPINK